MPRHSGTLPAYFPFFGLPPELRIEIFAYLVAEPLQIFRGQGGGVLGGSIDTAKALDQQPRIFIQGAPRLQILQVNRQMRDEYTHEISMRKPSLIIQGNGEPNINFRHALYRMKRDIRNLIAETIEEVEYHGMIRCDSCRFGYSAYEAAVEALEMHKWITDMLPDLHQLKKLKIYIGLWWPSQYVADWPKSPHTIRLQEALEELTNIPCVSVLEVFRCSMSWQQSFRDVDRARVFASWTEKSGWNPGRQDTEQIRD